jgi:PhnB protein
MPALNPYLNFSDNTEEVFNFYKSVFGGEFATVMRFKDAPSEHQASESEANKIMHIALPLGDGNVLMGSDTPAAYGKPVTGTNMSISVSTKSQEEADKIFNGLTAGGKTTMPLAKTFWGSYFGMLTDKYGIQWMVSHDPNRQN